MQQEFCVIWQLSDVFGLSRLLFGMSPEEKSVFETEEFPLEVEGKGKSTAKEKLSFKDRIFFGGKVYW